MKYTLLYIAAAAALFGLTACGGQSTEKRSKEILSKVDISLLPCQNSDKKNFYVDELGDPVIMVDEARDFLRSRVKPAPFCDGLAFIGGMSSEKVFINKEGETVIDCKEYGDDAEPVGEGFVGGMAYIYSKSSNETYVINTKGEIVVTIDGLVLSPFNEGYCLARQGDSLIACSIVNLKGETVFDANDGEFAFGTPYAFPTEYAVWDDEGFKYIMDIKTGKKWLEDVADISRYLSSSSYPAFDYNNLCIAQNDDRLYGLLNRKGEWVVEPQFDEMKPDGEWYAVKSEGLWGWCDKTGAYTIEPQYKYGPNFFGIDKWAMISGEKCYIDRQGIEVLEMPDEDMRPLTNFFGDRAIVRIGLRDSRGRRSSSFTTVWIDREGNEISSRFPLYTDQTQTGDPAEYYEHMSQSSTTLNHFFSIFYYNNIFF